MEERGKWKGTVTPLSAVMPAEEARKAAKKVEEAIADKIGHLNLLHRFVNDNNNTINLVKRLPDELHHDIMVPFGKAAFFPGRLVHTNEFRVLLGEGYYAERTSKQTVEILKRRGKTLDSQVDALKGMIDDLRLEATFFNSTAAESEEGLLEIREEYIEEDPIENTLKTGPQSVKNILVDDEDVSNKARMDELKRNEEKYAHTDDKEYAKMMARLDELEREEEEEEEKAAAAAAVGIDVDDPDDEELAQRISGLSDWVSKDQMYNCRENAAEKLKIGSLGLQSSQKVGQYPSKKDSLHSMKERSNLVSALSDPLIDISNWLLNFCQGFMCHLVSALIWILSKLCSKYMDHMKSKKPEILSDLDSTHDDDKFMERAKKLYQMFLSIRRDQKIDCYHCTASHLVYSPCVCKFCVW